jgi:hypothetical protein
MGAPLPDRQYVTLSEALSWVAFSNPLDRLSLNKELADTAFGLGFSAAKRQMEDSLEKLMDAASRDKVQFTGKHLLSHRSDPDGVKTQVIPPIECQNFRQFDITADALRFGSGLAWYPEADWSWRYTTNKRPEFFTQIKVRRSDLMHIFAARVDGLPATAKGQMPPLPESELKKWWGKLTQEQRELSRVRLTEMCSTDFPNNSIARQRIRDLTLGRMRGPKPNRRQNLAK